MKKIAILLTALLCMGAGCSMQPLQPKEQSSLEQKLAPQYKNDSSPKKMEETKKDDSMMKDEDSSMMEEKKDDSMKSEGGMETKPDATMSQGAGMKVVGEVKLASDEKSIVAFYYASKSDYKGKDAYAEIGCEDVLVPVKTELSKSQSDLAEAIVQLLTMKNDKLSDGLMNAVRGAGLSLANIRYNDAGARVIELEGQIKLAGVCDGPRIKAQIEETARLYSKNFEINLNGSAKDWRCAFDESGQCE